MHSPNEIVALEDLENCARLIAAYVKGLDKSTDFVR
jgi:endoglucanase